LLIIIHVLSVGKYISPVKNLYILVPLIRRPDSLSLNNKLNYRIILLTH